MTTHRMLPVVPLTFREADDSPSDGLIGEILNAMSAPKTPHIDAILATHDRDAQHAEGLAILRRVASGAFVFGLSDTQIKQCIAAYNALTWRERKAMQVGLCHCGRIRRTDGCWLSGGSFRKAPADADV